MGEVGGGGGGGWSGGNWAKGDEKLGLRGGGIEFQNSGCPSSALYVSLYVSRND